MPRRIPTDRFDTVVRKATEEFIARGYRRTQMADIADAVGVSKATLYLYVESKEALFGLCERYADVAGVIEIPESLPVREGEVRLGREQAAKRISESAVQPLLNEALGRKRAPDVRDELRGIVAELYDLMERHCVAIKLADRCWDHPEWGEAWQTAGRREPRDRLREYVELRQRAGQFASGVEARLMARLIIETAATWAIHIKWDRAPQSFDPEATRAAVIEYAVNGLLPRAGRS